VSNHLAIAGVTATLVQMLDEVVSADVPGANVAPGRPDTGTLPDSPPKVVVFLYRVEPNAAWRNEDLPSRGADGTPRRRPQAALTLHYLLTFAGDEAAYEPQRMLGSVVGTLHFHPLLTRDEIGQMVKAALQQDASSPFGDLDLAEQPDLVRFTPLQLSLEDLSTLWSSFFQVDYRLSVAYQADVVLLTPPAAPVTPLPVRERRLAVSTIRRPVLRDVVGVADSRAAAIATPIVSGAAVVLEGSDLRGDETTVVLFGEAEVTPGRVTGTELVATVPDDVGAGVVPVVVEHRRLMGQPPALRPAGRSNVVPVVVHPRIRTGAGGYEVAVTGATAGPAGHHSGTLTLTVDPAVAAGQEVSVLLDPVGGGAGVTLAGGRRDGPSDPPETHDLAIPFPSVPDGDYLVRVVVSGAQSALDSPTTGPQAGTFTAPVVSVP
jgi:hypothetical protein